MLVNFAICYAASYVPKGPKFSWETLPVFFHSSNSSGPFNDEAVQVGLEAVVSVCLINCHYSISRLWPGSPWSQSKNSRDHVLMDRTQVQNVTKKNLLLQSFKKSRQSIQMSARSFTTTPFWTSCSMMRMLKCLPTPP